MKKMDLKNSTIKISIMAAIFMIAACSPISSQPQSTVQIHDIQGCGHTSPYLGQQVNDIEGIVTHKLANGFTMQSVLVDDKDCTSEAIFVFTKNYPGVMVADLVSVDGVVDEFSAGNPEDHNLSQTEITQTKYEVMQSDHALPETILIDDLNGRIPMSIIENDGLKTFDPTEDGLDFYESLESMLVEIRSAVVVEARNTYDEITVLPATYIKDNLTSSQGALLRTIDDQNPEKVMIKLPSNFEGEINVGDQIESVIVGVIDYSFGNFKVLALSPLDITSKEQNVASFTTLQGGLTLATYNVENLSPLDGVQKYKSISKQIVQLLSSPDILVLNEIMDNSGSMDDGVVKADQTIMKLIDQIRNIGGPDYSYSDLPPYNNQDGGLEGGNIRTILLYRLDKGIQLETSSSLITDVDYRDQEFKIKENPTLIGEYSSAFNGTRKPRIWLLSQNGRQFFVVGVHLTSQGASTPDWGNLQPPLKPEENQRIEEGRLINQQLSKIYSLSPETPIFIVGDMNDLPWSNTVATVASDLFEISTDRVLPAENYSYIFEGNAQALDYILVNKNLAEDIIQTRYLHINTYLDRSDVISDHDPVMIEFRLTQSAP